MQRGDTQQLLSVRNGGGVFLLLYADGANVQKLGFTSHQHKLFNRSKEYRNSIFNVYNQCVGVEEELNIEFKLFVMMDVVCFRD